MSTRIEGVPKLPGRMTHRGCKMNLINLKCKNIKNNSKKSQLSRTIGQLGFPRMMTANCRMSMRELKIERLPYMCKMWSREILTILLRNTHSRSRSISIVYPLRQITLIASSKEKYLIINCMKSCIIKSWPLRFQRIGLKDHNLINLKLISPDGIPCKINKIKNIKKGSELPTLLLNRDLSRFKNKRSTIFNKKP